MSRKKIPHHILRLIEQLFEFVLIEPHDGTSIRDHLVGDGSITPLAITETDHDSIARASAVLGQQSHVLDHRDSSSEASMFPSPRSSDTDLLVGQSEDSFAIVITLSVHMVARGIDSTTTIISVGQIHMVSKLVDLLHHTD